jgi:hypothetical protein
VFFIPILHAHTCRTHISGNCIDKADEEGRRKSFVPILTLLLRDVGALKIDSTISHFTKTYKNYGREILQHLK